MLFISYKIVALLKLDLLYLNRNFNKLQQQNLDYKLLVYTCTWFNDMDRLILII